MGPDVLVPVAALMTGVAIVGVAQAGRTIRYYLDWRMRMAERQPAGGDPSLVQAVQDLRTEIAALRQHEAEAVLSFDSTLQTLDARMKNLETRALGAGSGKPALHRDAGTRDEEPVRPVVKSG